MSPTKSSIEKYDAQVQSLEKTLKKLQSARDTLFPTGSFIEFLISMGGTFVRCRGEVSPHQFIIGDHFGAGAESIIVFVDEPAEGMYLRSFNCKCHPDRKTYAASLKAILCAEWGMDRKLNALPEGGGRQC